MAWVPRSWEVQPYSHQIRIRKKSRGEKKKKEQGREISHCSLLSLPSLAAFCLRKCKRVPELVCDKDHSPFQKQGGEDSAQVPHAEGCEQGLEINMLKPRVKRPPQLDDLLERKRLQVSSRCPPILWQAWTANKHYWLCWWTLHSVKLFLVFPCVTSHKSFFQVKLKMIQSPLQWAQHETNHKFSPLDWGQGALHEGEN